MSSRQYNAINKNSKWLISAAGLTHQGQVREDNEDTFLLSSEKGLYLVCDGMGGTAAGKAVSNALTQALPVQIDKLSPAGAPTEAAQMASLLDKAVTILSDELLEQVSSERSLKGSGAAVVICWLINGNAAVAHMGDCRLYRLRAGQVEKLTDDHNIATLLVQMGQIDKSEALEHPGRHMLTRFVGMEPVAQPDVNVLNIVPGDRLLLCSDGFWGVVSEEVLYSLLTSDADQEAICEQMISAANAAGGPDNITVLIIDINSTN